MLIVHHLENSRSQRVLWLLEELSVPYEVKRYERDTVTNLAPKELLDIHPLGKSPLLEDDGEIIAETGAIFEYILTQYGNGKLAPEAGTKAARQLTYWLHYAEGSAMSPLLMKLVFSIMPERAPKLMKPLVRAVTSKAETGFVDPQLNSHIAYWEKTLSESEWFIGDAFTAADIMMSFPLEAAASRAGAADAPVIVSFLKRIHERPAYQAALKAGGPYAYA